MKKILLRVSGVVAVAIAALSCAKETSNPADESSNGGFKVNAVAQSVSTKTLLADDGTSVIWGEDEMFKGFLTDANGKTYLADSEIVNREADGSRIKFSHSFADAPETGTYTYNVLYPAHLTDKIDGAVILDNISLYLERVQYENPGQIPNGHDILVSKPVEGITSNSAEADVNFKRVSAITKLNLKNMNLEDGEIVESVEISIPGVSLVGNFSLNLVDGTADFPPIPHPIAHTFRRTSVTHPPIFLLFLSGKIILQDVVGAATR